MDFDYSQIPSLSRSQQQDQAVYTDSKEDQILVDAVPGNLEEGGERNRTEKQQNVDHHVNLRQGGCKQEQDEPEWVTSSHGEIILPNSSTRRAAGSSRTPKRS